MADGKYTKYGFYIKKKIERYIYKYKILKFYKFKKCKKKYI
jgi:hypothetical protein